MNALILAAGRGERMRPLTDITPKPLLPVRGKPLIEWHLEALARGGVRDVVINTAWLEEQFPATLGNGERWGLRIRYSTEGRDHGGALDTAGGIVKALPWLGECFWVVSGDVFLPGFAFDAGAAGALRGDDLMHLWLVPNAPHHPAGDFSLSDQGRLQRIGNGPSLTWASVGLFRVALFGALTPGHQHKLLPLLQQAIDAGRAAGTRWHGDWTHVGTAQRLASVDGRA
jgi:MurNAc alpha-1-phosphate uridylyltransferase